MKVTASAPGKAFLTGEYAVLAGAPALVTAIARRVVVTVSPAPRWTVELRFAANDTIAVALRATVNGLGIDPGAGSARDDRFRLLAALCRAMSTGDAARWQPATITIDSSELGRNGTKLGLGSSAAVAVALSGALATWAAGRPTDPGPGPALAAHDDFQAVRGSGADVVTSHAGGTVVVGPARTGQSVSLPAGLHWRWFWAGAPTSTPGRVERFRDWSKTDPGAGALVAALARASVPDLDHPDRFVAGIGRFAAALRDVDTAAGLGIYGPVHARLAGLATSLPVVYKPSGAGGGDLGFAVATGSAALDRLAERAVSTGAEPLALAPDPDGLLVAVD